MKIADLLMEADPDQKQEDDPVSKELNAIKKDVDGGLVKVSDIDDPEIRSRLSPATEEEGEDLEQAEATIPRYVYLPIIASSLDYIKEYNHDPNSDVHPLKIMNMDLEHLETLKDDIKQKIMSNSIISHFGITDEDDNKTLDDLLEFVSKVISIKKSVELKKEKGAEQKQKGNRDKDRGKPPAPAKKDK